jgi:RNA polymerase sporulation-specific sigma factor
MQRVTICGVNTSELKVLTGEEKSRLLKLAKEGDEKAREEFINGNLKLVLSVVQRFAQRGENPDDLFQIGCIGLIKSIDNFDTSQDVKFSTYAVPMIIGEIRRYLRDNNPIRVSRSMRDLAYRALSSREKLRNDLNRDPTVEEISKDMEIPREEIVVALDAITEPVSLFDPIYNDDSDSLFVMDQITDKGNTDESWIDEIALRQAISHLSPREKRILSLRFYSGKTQMEVAGHIGISQAQVSRLEKSAIEQIKKYF